jgi:hypothetical protein
MLDHQRVLMLAADATCQPCASSDVYLVIRPERRNEDLPPENLLIKGRSHAGCGFNVSTMCLLLHLHSTRPMTMCRDTVKRAERLWLGIVLQAVTMRDFGTTIALRTVIHIFLLEGLCIQSQRSTRRLRLMTSLLFLILSVLVVADH